MPVEKQVLIIWTTTNGLADDIAVEDLKRFETELAAFIAKFASGGFRHASHEKIY